jgi:hypothetical protein
MPRAHSPDVLRMILWVRKGKALKGLGRSILLGYGTLPISQKNLMLQRIRRCFELQQHLEDS